MSHDPYAREDAGRSSVWLIVAAVVCLLFFVLICGGIGAGVFFLAGTARDEVASPPMTRTAPFVSPAIPMPMQPAGGNADYTRFHSLRASGQFQASLDAIDAALQADPDNAVYNNDKAWLLSTCTDDDIRDGELAVTLAEKACQLTPQNEAFLDTLAAAHAEAGNFEKAIEYQQQAISINRQSSYSAGFAERLELYREGKPYREQPSTRATSDR